MDVRNFVDSDKSIIAAEFGKAKRQQAEVNTFQIDVIDEDQLPSRIHPVVRSIG
jgi:hypothetical protein